MSGIEMGGTVLTIALIVAVGLELLRHPLTFGHPSPSRAWRGRVAGSRR
jgi:hypothetical protein